jgi:hypothetical protein
VSSIRFSKIRQTGHLYPGPQGSDFYAFQRESALQGRDDLSPCHFKAALTTNPLAIAPVGILTNGTGWGNSGAGVIEAPCQFDFDASLVKNVILRGIREKAFLQVRDQFFNLLNHPQFANPANDPAVGSFGQITSTTVHQRHLQLALKYVF